MVDFASISLRGLRDAPRAGKPISRWVFEGFPEEPGVQVSRPSKGHCLPLYGWVAISLLKTQVEEKGRQKVNSLCV